MAARLIGVGYQSGSIGRNGTGRYNLSHLPDVMNPCCDGTTPLFHVSILDNLKSFSLSKLTDGNH
jgi:hypothetical protein